MGGDTKRKAKYSSFCILQRKKKEVIMTKSEIDYGMLAELAEIMGDDMQMLIETYISDSNQKLQRLKTLSPINDSEAIFRLAHSLKGSSRNLGITTFSNYCESIEDNARNDNLNESNYKIEKLFMLFETSVLLIKQKLT